MIAVKILHNKGSMIYRRIEPIIQIENVLTKMISRKVLEALNICKTNTIKSRKNHNCKLQLNHINLGNRLRFNRKKIL